MVIERLRDLVDQGCARALAELNSDPWSPTFGSFDRRFWAWKLVDIPEATYQRLVYPLTWLARRSTDRARKASLERAILAGMLNAARIQHADGSFDQAFPNERSWGATAFLLQPLAAGYQAVAEIATPADRAALERMCANAARFVTQQQETHGIIANHVAGGAYGLLAAHAVFGDDRYRRTADALIDTLLAAQSPEGWFPEYGGADPGYLSLCIHYLACAHELAPRDDLLAALRRATEFASWFVHPDGTYGGEYGSRRTGVFYPGGFALLGRSDSTASAMVRACMEAVLAHRAIGPTIVDIGNLAPVLSSCCVAVDAIERGLATPGALPAERDRASMDFSAAGLSVRGTPSRYVVCGVANGGTLTVYDRASKQLIASDSGYVACAPSGAQLTTQSTGMGRIVESSETRLRVRAPFVAFRQVTPTPAKFMALRVMGLALGLSITLGNVLKAAIVRAFIRPSASPRGYLERDITITDGPVRVRDVLHGLPSNMQTAHGGERFVSVHMASARYFVDAFTGARRTIALTSGPSRESVIEWSA